MRIVTFRDERGYLRRSLVRDGDGDDAAIYGLPTGEPRLDEEVDWEEIKRLINDEFVKRGIVTWIDLQQKGGLNVAASILKRHIADVFRRRATEAKHGIK